MSSTLTAETVRGYVINPISGAPVGNAEIAFFISQDGQVSEILRKPADTQGRFAFSGPFLKPELSFVLVALYQGIHYPSSELQIGGQREIILEVYEPTTVDEEIRLASHTLFLSLRSEGLEVAQFVQADNQGEKTYVGQLEGTARRVTEFALPAGVFELAGNLNPAGENRFFDNRPLPPGLSQITFNFRLDPQRLDGGYLHQVLYPTDQLEVYLQPAAAEPSSPFEDLGTVDLHGEQYRRLGLDNLQRGQKVLIPLPLPPPPLRWILKWIALGTVAITPFLALAQRPAPAVLQKPDLETLKRQRLELIQQLAQLDDAYAEGLEEPRYLRKRERLMGETLAVYHQLENLDEHERT